MLIHSFNCAIILIQRLVAIFIKNNKIFKCENKIYFIVSYIFKVISRTLQFCSVLYLEK
jgi:hypothetical protein